MKNLYTYIILLSFYLSSCGVAESFTNNTREFFYPTKSRFEVFNEVPNKNKQRYFYQNPNNYRNKFDTKNLFTLRIKENEKYVKLENGLISELPYRHFFADTTQALIDNDILEETYLYIDGLSEDKPRGLAIFFNTFPVISAEQDSNYMDSKKVFLDNTKSMKTGLWLKQDDKIYILFNTGDDDVPITAQIIYSEKEIRNEAIKAVNFIEITHPQSIAKSSHRDKMKDFKTAIVLHPVYVESEKDPNSSSNRYDLNFPDKFIDSLITTFFTSTTVKMKNVFDLDKAKGLPFIVNSKKRIPGIKHEEEFYQWTHFEVTENHRIIFETEKYSSGKRTGIKKNFVYKDKYLSNLSPR